MSGIAATTSEPGMTFPRLLQKHAAERGDRAALREKDLGIWQSYSWRECLEQIQALAGGLASLGFKRGDALAVVGENRPRLYWALTAAQSLGGIPAPLYQDAVAQELAFVLQNADIEFAIVEDQEQVDKLLEAQSQCPKLKYIVYDDPRGLRKYADAMLLSFDALLQRGREFNQLHPDFFQAEINKGQTEDAAALFYTSGTTGHPKGVVLTHAAMIAAGRAYSDFEGIGDEEELLAYLPMAWIGQNLFSYAQFLVAGFCVSCPESADTVMTDMREIGPTYYFAPPRVLEGLLTTVMIRMEDASYPKRRMFHYFMELAKRVGSRILDGEPVSTFDRLRYALGDVTTYGPLRNALGMSRVRVAYTAGEAIGPDLFVFYRSIGINLKQLYGQTETSVYVCVQPNGGVRADTVGPPLPGCEIKVSPEGEILVKTPGLFREYFKNPQATADAKDAEGWFHTGDAGFFERDGHLKIIDRAKDVGKLNDGTLFAPKYLENKLKFFPHIKEAVAFGDHRDNVTAMINIDLAAVGDWAERRNIGYAGYIDLASRDEVYALVQDCIQKVNRDLANDPKLSGSQITRFIILHKELDADDGELTRTRKVRRRIVGEKYAAIIDALYSTVDHVEIEAQVKFEDGRSGMVRADLKIRNAKTYPASDAIALKEAA